MRSLGTFRILATAAVAAVLAAHPGREAAAKVGVGDSAPDFEGRDFWNTSPVTLKSLRGRLVFVELFSTG
jgi:hypothetical protein